MFKRIKEKVTEAMSSIIPVMIIMLLIGFYLKFNLITMLSIMISTLLLIAGVSMFTLGADLSMLEIGKTISSGLLKTRKVWIITLVSFIVGVVITIAEPDLKVLAEQMTAIDSSVLILSVGVGVGLFLSIAAIRIMYQINLKIIIACCYTILLIMLFISSKEMIPLAFDSGGVTTGPMSVPFILAMGIGFTTSRKKSKNDSFGLVALCSIGPILTVLILGLLLSSNMTYTYNIEPEVTNIITLISNYIHEIFPIFKEVLISLLPILGLFIIFGLITKNVSKKQVTKVTIGIPITLIGLTLFFIGVNVGYLPVAYLIGINLYTKSKLLLIPLGMLIGFVIVKAEPAVSVLTEQIEKITEGSIKKSVMNNTIAIGVAIAVGISIFRVTTGTPITCFLIIGYLLAMVLMKFTPDIFTMVAFDSGGAVTGPMTTTFLLPLIIGICYATNGNVLTDAFGLVALVALSPLITIQTLGIIYNLKSRKQNILDTIDESIIDFKRGDQVE